MIQATPPTSAVQIAAPVLEAETDNEKQTRDELLREAYSKENIGWGNVSWPIFGWLAFVHVGCIAAPFFISWQAVVVCAVLHWLTASIGICLGYHRYLAHQSLKLKTPAEFFVLMCGGLAGEGSPCHWAATHRVHHHKSDKPGDPHSPREGAWWSHLLWLFPRLTDDIRSKLHHTYVPDVFNRPLVMFFERTFAFWLLLPTVALGAAGYLWSGWFGAASLVLWGVCARMTFTYHSTWFVNSATHLWGYKNYENRDDSKNLWWVAILAYGEGWHNNHHAHPSVAPAGHRWFEIDMTYWFICFLRAIGQATDVKSQLPERKVKRADARTVREPQKATTSATAP